MAIQDLLICKGEQLYYPVSWTKKNNVTGVVSAMDLSNLHSLVYSLENQRNKSLKVFSYDFVTQLPLIETDSPIEIINLSNGLTRILLTKEYINSLETNTILLLDVKYKTNDLQEHIIKDGKRFSFKVTQNVLSTKVM